jgi:hypothetical protein
MLSRIEFRCAVQWAEALADGVFWEGTIIPRTGRLLDPFGAEAWRSALLTVRLLLMGLNPQHVPARLPLWQPAPLDRRRGAR